MNIDWLSSELDDSETACSSSTSTTDEEESEYLMRRDSNGVDIHFSNSKKQCVIVELVDGKVERCKNSAVRSLKQLMGMWELDFNTVDETLKMNDDSYALRSLGVCSSHHNFDQDGLHPQGSKSKISIEKSIIHKKKVSLLL